MARLVIKNGHQKDVTFYDEILLCAQNKTPCPNMFNNGYKWESSGDHSKNNFLFSWDSLFFCFSSLI